MPRRTNKQVYKPDLARATDTGYTLPLAVTENYLSSVPFKLKHIFKGETEEQCSTVQSFPRPVMRVEIPVF